MMLCSYQNTYINGGRSFSTNTFKEVDGLLLTLGMPGFGQIIIHYKLVSELIWREIYQKVFLGYF